MAAKGFGVKEGITWYMLSNILLAEGRGYSLGKKIVEENSNYENRKYTHKRKTLLYSKVAIIENKKKLQGRQMQTTSALLHFSHSPT